MAREKASTSRGEDAAELVGEASCRGADVSSNPGSIPSAIAAESPSFFTWMWTQILIAFSGVCGARGGGLSGPTTSGRASGAQRTQEDSESCRIAASKSTWSEVPNHAIHRSVLVPCPGQLSAWEELKESSPFFFVDGLEDLLEVGRLIGEGAQAQIFEAKWKGHDEPDLVLKVFKLDAGFSLADLKCHWPRSMRKDDGESDAMSASLPGVVQGCSRFVFEDSIADIDGDRCWIVMASLLRDGRFAFLMRRYWGDLRKLIDFKVKGNTHRWTLDFMSPNRRVAPPFSYLDSILMMLQIARGMHGLHAESVSHRDLKAANVLIDNPKDGPLYCYVADYECAMFVQGTGFWRAPEVLQELQKKEEKDRNGDIWTEKVDVYSFGMTCYEILIGQIPFDGYTKSKWVDVIKGERPFLSDYVCPKLRKLVEACWHVQPSQRPSFEVIIEKLDSLFQEHRV